MKCIKCEDSKALSYYSPKELTKYNIYFCNKCIKILKCEDLELLSYLNNNECINNEIKRLIKKR